MPRTLFSRTVLIISSFLLIFVLLASVILFYYIMAPMARQSASHLATLVSLATNTWNHLPKKQFTSLKVELKKHHGIVLKNHKQDFEPLTVNSPFLRFFKKELFQHLDQDIELFQSFSPKLWIWVKIPSITKNSKERYIGFSHEIIGPNPPLALFILISLGIILVIFSSLYLVSYLVKPIKNLLTATKELGKGILVKPIKESGPEELVQLTQSFNTMNTQIHDLLQNRTILLAGISHDLRTPIARVYLALEMLSQQQDQLLIDGIRNDLKEMNELIQKTLDFSKGLDVNKDSYESVVIDKYIKNYVLLHPSSDKIRLEYRESSNNNQLNQFLLPVKVLKRILNNLVENAINYSLGKDITIYMTFEEKSCQIHIIDQGKGIPEDKLNSVFEPFYRLETSRNSNTGGTGLGLAIVQQLSKAHGWKVILKNNKSAGLEAVLILRRSVK